MCSFSNLFDYRILFLWSNLRGRFSVKHTLGSTLFKYGIINEDLELLKSKNILDVDCLKQNVLRLNGVCGITD